MRNTDSPPSSGYLRRLGIQGFDAIEPVILAALATGDPLLLIGHAGTGKTLLLNILARVLGLEHRHYNASLVSFDDLVGYPYPSADGSSVSFLPTPATIWQAESVLIDEISRTKPEVQNKFFTLIHECVLQGISLTRLRYRWAAMNPFGAGKGRRGDSYDGSQPLDPALADRFGFIVVVPDWNQLSAEDQHAVITAPIEEPAPEAAEALRTLIGDLRDALRTALASIDNDVALYTRFICSFLADAGLPLSPRRARLLARNITAVRCVANALGWPADETHRANLFRLALHWSIPQRAHRTDLPEQKLAAAHAEAARLAFEEDRRVRWMTELLVTENPAARTAMLIDPDIDKDTRSLAIARLMGRETPDRWSMLAFCLYPYCQEHGLLTDDALDMLARTAAQVLEVDSELVWQETGRNAGAGHPDWSRCQQVLDDIPDSQPTRKARARNLFLHLLAQEKCPFDPPSLELEMTACMEAIRKQIAQPIRA